MTDPRPQAPAPAPRETDRETDREAAARFRSTLARVMAVQVATLLLLWLLQSRYTA